MIRLTLPYPVSANRYWQPVRIGKRITIVPTRDAKAYKAECGLRARIAGVREPLAGVVALRVRLVPKNRVCMDLDNCLKVSIDALKGVVYGDDAQVYRITAERCEPDSRGARLEIDIERIDQQVELDAPLRELQQIGAGRMPVEEGDPF